MPLKCKILVTLVYYCLTWWKIKVWVEGHRTNGDEHPIKEMDILIRQISAFEYVNYRL